MASPTCCLPSAASCSLPPSNGTPLLPLTTHSSRWPPASPTFAKWFSSPGFARAKSWASPAIRKVFSPQKLSFAKNSHPTSRTHMKINTHTRTQGSALLLALLTAFVICIALTTYLYLVSNQNRSVMRSMAWNSSIPVVEAGVEEALTQLNYTAVVNMAANGWSPLSADGFYHKNNDLGNGFAYDVGVKPAVPGGPDQPTSESIGYAPAPANIAS